MAKSSRVLTLVRRYFPDVNTVSDSNNPQMIEVTKVDARTGRKKDANECALAKACRRKWNADGVIISIRYGYIIKGTHATRFRLPESASREIVTFDRTHYFAPGKYELKAVGKWARIGAKKSSPGKTVKGHNGAGRATYRHFTEGVRVFGK